MTLLLYEPELRDVMEDQDEKCPKCDNNNPETIKVLRLIGGRRGHEHWCGLVKCLDCGFSFVISPKNCSCALGTNTNTEQEAIFTSRS